MDPFLYIKIVCGIGATLIAAIILISSFRHKGVVACFITRRRKPPKQWREILLLGLFCFVGQWLCRIKVVVQRDSQIFVDVEEGVDFIRIQRGGQTYIGDFRRTFSGQEAEIAQKGSILTLTWPFFEMWSVATPDVEPLPFPPPPQFVSVGIFGRRKAFKKDLMLIQPFPISWKRFCLGVLCYILAIYLYFKRFRPAPDKHFSFSTGSPLDYEN